MKRFIIDVSFNYQTGAMNMRKLHQTFVPAGMLMATMMIFAGANAIVAQVPGVPPGQLRAEEEMKRHELEAEKSKKRDPKETLAEVNEDLIRLNALNEIFGATLAATDTPLDYIAFSERAGEVKARSVRLRTNLALPMDEKAEKHDVLKGIDSSTLPPMLTVLNKLLTSFTHNPIFSDTGGLDMQLASKARQDLEDIIVVSEKVRKTSDKLRKTKP